MTNLLVLAASLATAAASGNLRNRALHAESSSLGYPPCPNCTVATKAAILDTTKDLLDLTKAAYDAKGKVWYWKGKFVEYNCPDKMAAYDWSGSRRRALQDDTGDGVDYTTTSTDTGSTDTTSYPDYTDTSTTSYDYGSDSNNGGVGEYYPSDGTDQWGYFRDGSWYSFDSQQCRYNSSACGAKSVQLALAKKTFATSVRVLAAKVGELADEASTCSSALGQQYAQQYRRLWAELTYASNYNELGFLETCLDKMKYLLESLMSLEKTIICKVSYGLTLEDKLAKAFYDLSTCEASYGADGSICYDAWKANNTYITEYYGVACPSGTATDDGEMGWTDESQWEVPIDGGYGDYYNTDGTYDNCDPTVDDTCRRRQLTGSSGWYKYVKCTPIVSKVAWLQSQLSYVDTATLKTVAQTVQVGTWMTAKAGKCFAPESGRRV